MEALLIALEIASRNANTEARSALPNAPVVDDAPRRRHKVRALPRIRWAVPTRPRGRLTLSADSGIKGAGWDESHCRPSPTT
jgi:hypothetical protein